MRTSILILITALVVLFLSTFTVKQTEKGLILRFGKIVCDNANQPIIYNPGLHFKILFLDTVKKIDNRVHTLDMTKDSYITKDHKNLIVNYYLKWRIKDFSRYYISKVESDLYKPETVLKSKVSDILSSYLVSLNMKDIINNSSGRLTSYVRDTLNTGSDSRSGNLLDHGNSSVIHPTNIMAVFGIEVVDCRIKSLALPSEVSEALYKRMRAEREARARQHRSQGQQTAVKIHAIADKTVTETLAVAERTALRLHGEGDAIATKLFADAFHQYPEFYSFMRSLRAYENMFSKNINNGDVMVGFNTNTDFFRYMHVPTKLTQK